MTARIFDISGSYGQPIVASLTPWQKAQIALPETRKDWPPLVDADRLTRYEEYLALIENRPMDVFEDLRLRDDQRSKIALAVALPELLCNVWADSVWSDPPEIELPSSALDDKWQAIDFANDWTEIGAWESVFATAAFGHSIVRLYRDEERMARYETDVVIEEIDPAIYFPKLRRGSARVIEYIVLAWEEDRSGPETEKADLWQIRELHEVDGGQYRITTQERRPRSSIFGGETDFRTVKEEAPDGVDFLPFVDMHAKRWRGRYWGISEVGRNSTLFDETDNTLSNIAEILEYHGKPMLQVPASWMYGGVLNKGADRVAGVRRPEDADVARYITFDGMIEQQIASLGQSIDLILMTSEVPRTYFGQGDLGSSPSGTSLKLQLQNYVKKATRYQRAETRRTRELVDMALRLEGITLDVNKPAKITHGSPLPVDDVQEATIETGLYTAGLSSQKTSIRRLRRVDDVDEEIAEIEAEKEANKPDPLPVIVQGSQTPQNAPRAAAGGVTDPNAPEPPAAG